MFLEFPFSALICLFGVLRRFQHCTGHITTGSWKGRGNQYIEFVRVLYCKLPTNGKQLPAFPRETVRGSNPGLRGGRRECYHSATVAPLFCLERISVCCINFALYKSFYSILFYPCLTLKEGSKVKSDHITRFPAHDFL